jgi:hypothetical protein
MLSKIIEEGGNVEVSYICFAADLLQRMMWQLQCLEASYFELALAMAAGVGGLRRRLHALSGIIELLTSTDDSGRTPQMVQQAKALIGRLAGEMEELARLTDHHDILVR